MTKKKFEGIVARVCVCPECRYIYVTNSEVECENEECQKQGEKGVMCNVIVPYSLKDIPKHTLKNLKRRNK